MCRFGTQGTQFSEYVPSDCWGILYLATYGQHHLQCVCHMNVPCFPSATRLIVCRHFPRKRHLCWSLKRNDLLGGGKEPVYLLYILYFNKIWTNRFDILGGK